MKVVLVKKCCKNMLINKIFHIKYEKANLLNVYVEGGLSYRKTGPFLQQTR